MKRRRHARRGATIILMLMLITVVFIFVAFAVDIGRIQLAQLKLQTASDLAARASAEAMSRGVGDTSNLGDFESAVRDECEMIMGMNQLFGSPVSFNANTQLTFGIADEDVSAPIGGNGMPKIQFSQQANFTMESNSVSVTPDINQFPMIFGGFMTVKNVDMQARSTSMVQERDIVVVLDKSTSMLERNAGSIPFTEYPSQLFLVEDALYGPGDAYYNLGSGDDDDDTIRSTEFEISGGNIQLTKMQALKLALYQFRQVMDQTPGNEQLGLTAYSNFADTPNLALLAPGPVNVHSGLSASAFSAIVTDGICDNAATPNSPTESTVAELEGQSSNYDNFDFNYLKMRWSGNTNITDGIEVGAQILSDPTKARPVAQPIMIVLTDGIHNEFRPEDAASPTIAAQNAVAAIPNLKIYTITFGSGANQPEMISVAQASDGEHYHASNAASLVEVFRDLARNAGVRMIE